MISVLARSLLEGLTSPNHSLDASSLDTSTSYWREIIVQVSFSLEMWILMSSSVCFLTTNRTA